MIIEDCEGNKVTVSQEAVQKLLQDQGVQLFGLDVPAILALRACYINGGGSMPVTAASVEAGQWVL